MHKKARRSPVQTRSSTRNPKRQLLFPSVNDPVRLERQLRRDKRIELLRSEPVEFDEQTTVRVPEGYQIDFPPFNSNEDFDIPTNIKTCSSNFGKRTLNVIDELRWDPFVAPLSTPLSLKYRPPRPSQFSPLKNIKREPGAAEDVSKNLNLSPPQAKPSLSTTVSWSNSRSLEPALPLPVTETSRRIPFLKTSPYKTTHLSLAIQ